MIVKKHSLDCTHNKIRVLEFFSEERKEPYRFELRNQSGELAVVTFSEKDQAWHAHRSSGTAMGSDENPDELLEHILRSV